MLALIGFVDIDVFRPDTRQEDVIDIQKDGDRKRYGCQEAEDHSNGDGRLAGLVGGHALFNLEDETLNEMRDLCERRLEAFRRGW